MNYVLMGLDVLAGAIIFFYAICQLARKKWKLYQPELLAHALLAGSSVYLIGSVFQGHLVFAEVMMNVAFALYLSTRQIRSWQIQCKKRF